MKVVVNGRVTLYEPRGDYQIDVIQIIPHGKGDLYAAFEELKEKLQKEGLFDPRRKRPIPLLPRKIGIITSPTGAVIRDILNILNRRYMNLQIVIFPATVQGEEAAPSVVEGIRVMNRFPDIDVLVVARGGGSIEDLWPFNEERVARAIAASRIPVISAVGHETDTTIADFAADLRAPTPSAAAELVIAQKSQLIENITNFFRRMQAALRTRLLHHKNFVHVLAQNRALAGFPQTINLLQQTVDDFEARLQTGLRKYHQIQTTRLLRAQRRLSPAELRHLIELKRSSLQQILVRLSRQISGRAEAGHRMLARLTGKLDSLSPLAVLERGYSIVSDESGIILKQSTQTGTGQTIRVRLHRGKLVCTVQEVDHEP